MKKTIICSLALLCLTIGTKAQTISSPDGKIQVTLDLQDGKPCYSVNYEGQAMLNRSALGVVTNIGDYTQGLTLKEGFGSMPVSETYTLRNIKQRQVSYQANEGVATYLQNNQPVMDIIFRVSNRDVAFRYKIYPKRDTRVCVVQNEASGFVLPEGTTTFLCPQSKPMGGFARTSPSYDIPSTMRWVRMAGVRAIPSPACLKFPENPESPGKPIGFSSVRRVPMAVMWVVVC